MSNVGPIQGDRIEEKYNIEDADWQAMDPSERAMFRMAYAADVGHVEEDPRGSNSGPEIDRVMRISGVDTGQPWCAAIWSAYLVDSGVRRDSLPNAAASVHGWGRWAGQQARFIDSPVRGCVALIYHDETTGHLTVVTDVDGDNVETLSGNTNNDRSREGYGVFRVTYNKGAFAHFVNCKNLG